MSKDLRWHGPAGNCLDQSHLFHGWGRKWTGGGCGYKEQPSGKHNHQVLPTVRHVWWKCAGLTFTKGIWSSTTKKSFMICSRYGGCCLRATSTGCKVTFAWYRNACCGIRTLCRGILGVMSAGESSTIITSNRSCFFLNGVQIKLECQDLSLPPGQ